MTETTRRRITTARKLVRQMVLTLTLVILAAVAALALAYYLYPHDTAARQRKATDTLATTWAGVRATATALCTW